MTATEAFSLDVRGQAVGVAAGGVIPDAASAAEAPVVLLVHGAGMNRTVWQLQTRWLAHHGYTPLAIDLPGHGNSDGEPLGSVAEMAAWLTEAIAAVREQLGCDEVRLVGHSMGSLVCTEVAAAHPDGIARLVLLGTAAGMPVHPALLGAAENNELLAPELMTAWGHGNRAHVATNPTPGLWMLGGSVALLERADDGVIHADLSACAAYEAGDVAARVQCPVTVIVGSEDKMTPPRAAGALIADFADCDVVHLAGAGHMMMNEDPAAVRSALANALA
ncbi:MAG: alpha/beta hydrolase [Acidimicrobiaceae bacterium]|nr:alpha/beta hydrolase [Acidimicrobiaceae bacterium]MDE0497140.1 alpha/beta hydrolase [Acidimicrobiaceae bacterium]